MISVEEAQAALIAAAPSTPGEAVPLADAVGRVLREPVVALRTQPPFRSSAMDGYAVRAADMSGPVRVVGESAAGRRWPGALGPGEAVRIFTGAPVPDEADAVLIQEDATREGDSLTALADVAPGDHVRAEGLDFRSGDGLVDAGTTLAARHVALAGAAGHARLVVAARPRVALLATGDELVLPGTPAGPDQIVASTSGALAAMLREAGCDAVDLGIALDDRRELASRVGEGTTTADVLVTLGGASVGEHDLVRLALADIGVTPDFWRVAVRPGKPLMFASRPPVLGLPGNPVSAIVCAILFLIPFVRAMQRASDPLPRTAEGTLGAPVNANGPRRDHMRARLEAGRVVPFPVQDSSMLSTLSQADVLLVRQPRAPASEAGAPCCYIPL